MPDNGYNVVVVGASAGGVEALTHLVGALPANFRAPVLVVLHVPATGSSVLPAILDRAGPLPARHAEDGKPLEAGCVYVAPPDCHLMVEDGVVSLSRGPRENGHRPAIDPLFRTAAAAYGAHVAGVILSGTLDDGTVGLLAIKQAGGVTLVQDPEEALYPSMPLHAIAYVQPDHVLRVTDIADTLVRLAEASKRRQPKEPVMTEAAPNPSGESAQPGALTPFSCPDCGGSLWEVAAGDVSSFRCRVGHAYTINSLVDRHADAVERALWTAYRALEERAAMSRRIARRLTDRGRQAAAGRFERQADGSSRQADELKRILDVIEAAPETEDEEVARAG
jgi:two-component system, chemotaxis family, protein-glutamate methylesterase/glutaminase